MVLAGGTAGGEEVEGKVRGIVSIWKRRTHGWQTGRTSGCRITSWKDPEGTKPVRLELCSGSWVLQICMGIRGGVGTPVDLPCDRVHMLRGIRCLSDRLFTAAKQGC